MGLHSKSGRILILLLLPLSAFAGVNDRGASGNGTSEAFTQMGPTSGNTIAAGSTGVLMIAADNANGATSNFPLTATDSAGNTWRRRQNAVAGSVNASVEVAIYTSVNMTSPLTSSGYVTITYSAANVTAKCWSFAELVPTTTGNIWIQRASATSNGSGTTPTVNTTAVTFVNDVVIGWTGVKDAGITWTTPDADTLNGTWSTQQTASGGSGTSGQAISSQWKTQTTNFGSQTYNLTIGTSRNYRNAVLNFVEVPPTVRACSGNGTGAASDTITVVEPISTGSICALVWGGDNSGAAGSATNLSTVTDTIAAGGNNTWTQQKDVLYDNGAAGVGVEIGIYTAPITTALAVGDTLSIAYGGVNVPSKGWILYEFSAATAVANSGGSSLLTLGTGTTGTPSITTGSISNGNYAIGVLGLEGTAADVGLAGTTDTTNGTWSSPIVLAGGGVTGSMNGVASQFKKVTAAGTQTFNPTLTSTDTIMGWLELTAPPLVTAKPYQHFISFFP